MKITETKLAGSFVIEGSRVEDSRGYFVRTWCQREFSEAGLEPHFVQSNQAYNKFKSTLRGMHMQHAPHAEDKLVCCTRGALYDVMIDLRTDSPTCGQWFGIELSMDNLRSLYIPKGFAHGYQTLVDDTTINYQVSEFYMPGSECGYRWDDPFFDIRWPAADERIISDKDMSWPDYVHEAGRL